MIKPRVTALAGGIGAAKLLEGLYHELHQDLTIITNVGDDDIFFGLNVSPDLDIITYSLAGIIDPERRWGLAGETFRCMGRLKSLYPETWFNLGDMDLATHIFRTDQLRQGKTLTDVTLEIGKKLGLNCTILPPTNDPVQTKLHTSEGILDFEQYFVKCHTNVGLDKIEYRGGVDAKPAPGVLDAIRDAERIVICPSNPMLSIAPILAIPQIRQAISARRDHVIAVTSIIQGDAVKGPTAKNFREFGFDASPLGVVEYYGSDLFRHFVADTRDASLLHTLPANKFNPPVAFSTADTLMVNIEKKIELAQHILRIKI